MVDESIEDIENDTIVVICENIESDTIMDICVERGGANENVTSALKLQASTSHDITALVFLTLGLFEEPVLSLFL